MSVTPQTQSQFLVSEQQLVALQQMVMKMPWDVADQPMQLLKHIATNQKVKPPEEPTGEGEAQSVEPETAPAKATKTPK